MPRNLTDLMEAAVSAAPPEPHPAADITRLAQRRQRRRTTLIAGGAALAVVLVAGVTVGLSQDRPTTPEPTDHFLHGRTVDVSSAVPASSLPGYRLEPWTIPSIQHAGPGYSSSPTYEQIDADGRLIVVRYVGARNHQTPRFRLFDGPGQQPRPWDPPTAKGRAGKRLELRPDFTADHRLRWSTITGDFRYSPPGIHLTDLDGADDVFVHTLFTVAPGGQTAPNRPWVWGDRLWFTSFDGGSPQALTYSLYTATFAGALTKVASHVAAAVVDDGVAAWVTTSGQLMTESASGGPQHSVTVPLPAGCRMPSTETLQNEVGLQYLAVSRSVIALTAACGGGSSPTQEILAFDLSGQLLVHVAGVYALSPSLGGDDVVFTGNGPGQKVRTYRYDLVTGSLATLDQSPARRLQDAQAAGDYVLWYDGTGGHVAHFGD